MYRESTRQGTGTSPPDSVNDSPVPVLLEDPVPRGPGGLKGLNPANPKGAWGSEITESRQSPGCLMS